MANLDNLEEIKQLDSKQTALSIEKLPFQFEQAWRESSQISFPSEYKAAQNIFVVGMGGSALGPEVVYYLTRERLPIPLTLVRDYSLPAAATKNSLVIVSSYSGTTEEVLAAATQAKDKGLMITGITQGADLGEFLRAGSYPAYIFTPENNPSGQPRLGLGYLVGGILGLLNSAGFTNFEDSQIESTINFLKGLNETLKPEIATEKNAAKRLASVLVGRGIGIVGAEFLSGNAHVFSNQINENAKNFAFPFLLSELNHHLLEGLGFPKALEGQLKFVFLESDLYSTRLRRRVEITKTVFAKQNVEALPVKLTGDSGLAQIFEALTLSSWTSFYLGILNGVDPSSIPWVDFFKSELEKSQ